ncbi:MAG: sugar phosphate isomerase/epimerase [Chitinophagaceae bacterium]|nr:sugar phosphate isomerase/epimerase [Chitinophagaceae bacterium]
MNSSRRDFIRHSSVLSAGLFISKDEWFKTNKNIGVQLYTLRADMGKDPKGTLQKLSLLGYKEVETFGYNKGKWFGMTAAELKDVLKSNGLSSPSGHTFPGGTFLKDGWEDNWKQAVEDAKALGQKFIVIPWLEEQHRKPMDNYKKIAAGLNKAAGICKQVGGIEVAYHNHDFEFVKEDGQSGFDILMKETDPKQVKMELDIYWAVKAGHNPIDLFNAHPGRFVMWHVKDIDNTDKKFFTEVGNGTIDWKPIFAQAKKSGMKHFFVEQDVCPGPPIESVGKSISYLKKNIVK